MDKKYLNKVLENSQLDNEDFQQVFTFVENITGQNISIDHLAPEEIETWNCKFGEVIEQLIDEQCEKGK